jgi:hypothetical protein
MRPVEGALYIGACRYASPPAIAQPSPAKPRRMMRKSTHRFSFQYIATQVSKYILNMMLCQDRLGTDARTAETNTTYALVVALPIAYSLGTILLSHC